MMIASILGFYLFILKLKNMDFFYKRRKINLICTWKTQTSKKLNQVTNLCWLKTHAPYRSLTGYKVKNKLQVTILHLSSGQRNPLGGHDYCVLIWRHCSKNLARADWFWHDTNSCIDVIGPIGKWCLNLSWICS
jgi:hypothetical protein